MFSKTIDTGVEIDAAAEKVWGVLADLASYIEWNPMIRSASGELEPGTRLSLRFEPAGRKGKDFRPKLLVVEPGRELRWLGNPGVPGILESEHYFILERRGTGTRLVHGMVFYGLLVPLIGGRLARSVRGPFEDMNAALKERAEAK